MRHGPFRGVGDDHPEVASAAPQGAVGPRGETIEGRDRAPLGLLDTQPIDRAAPQALDIAVRPDLDREGGLVVCPVVPGGRGDAPGAVMPGTVNVCIFCHDKPQLSQEARFKGTEPKALGGGSLTDPVRLRALG